MMESLNNAATDIALAQLGKLITAGASPDLVTRTIGEIVSAWATEPEMDAVSAAARIELLWDSLSRDAADLQEQISDAPAREDQALSMAKRALTAMQAAVAALASAHARLQA
jgi:hypothetical protein